VDPLNLPCRRGQSWKRQAMFMSIDPSFRLQSQRPDTAPACWSSVRRCGQAKHPPCPHHSCLHFKAVCSARGCSLVAAMPCCRARRLVLRETGIGSGISGPAPADRFPVARYLEVARCIHGASGSAAQGLCCWSSRSRFVGRLVFRLSLCHGLCMKIHENAMFTSMLTC
jgi:hypothetical protein